MSDITTISINDILKQYPDLGEEIEKAGRWFDVPLKFSLGKQPMAVFSERAERAIAAHRENPEDFMKTNIIIDVLNSGGTPWPIFLYGEDDFLLEGWHRIVAFHILGMQTVDIIYVHRDAPKINSSEFSIEELVLEIRNEWLISARWKEQQIAHLRIAHDKPLLDGGRHPQSTFVLPAFRGRGIAKMLYDAAEVLLNEKGLYLAPSPEPLLSDSAFRIWKKRRPDLLKRDSRLK